MQLMGVIAMPKNEKIETLINDKEIVKEIYVKNRIYNIVIK